jgi:MtrB/PioB family decaheme-associated outer membrane protein
MKLGFCILMAITGMIANLLPFSPAFSEDTVFEGQVTLQGVYYDVNGSKAKFHEYSDSRDNSQALGEITFLRDSPTEFISSRGTDIGYDTQHYRLEGGRYGAFKAWFDYNEIIHNITEDARTFYSGVGSGILAGMAGTDSNTWISTFDYYTKRKRFDSGADFNLLNPFFFNVNYMYEQKEGVQPTGAAATSPGGIALELPQPVDYTTNGLRLEGGYAKNPFFISVGYTYNDFGNGIQDLHFIDASGTFLDPFSLPPDSTLNRFDVRGSVRLPLNSRFSLNIANARTESDTTSFALYDGKVDTSTYDFALTGNPCAHSEAKLYYKYYDRDNKSGVTNDPLFPTFSYTTKTYGGDLNFKLPAKLRLDTGYKHVTADRKVEYETDPAAVLPDNTDNIYFAGLKWVGLDFMSAKAGYERLERDADYRTFESKAMQNQKFIYAPQNRDTWKAALDIFPTDALNFGLEYNHKKADYRDTTYGLAGDKRDALNFAADYVHGSCARLSGYFDAEKITLDRNMIRNASRWDLEEEQKTFGYGIRTDIYVIPKKLTLVLRYDYLRANGFDDFTFYDNSAAFWAGIGVPQGSPVDIPNWDDYQRYTLGLTAVYNFSESLVVRAGYAYERFRYSDAQYDNYQYIAADPAVSSKAYLTGAYSNPSYSANVVFLGVTYLFR